MTRIRVSGVNMVEVCFIQLQVIDFTSDAVTRQDMVELLKKTSFATFIFKKDI